ncbi:MAG: NADH-quinone oxidoreductase subunit NuoN [Gallionella sp.]|nr:NADH-quinone oxidoreductase subunit NuoN [Gallionella sp.]MDD4947253.1 NADH-quinone oxidoreductase subunit NuoN [Gallionella sp.]
MNLLANLIPAGAEIFLLVMVCFILIADLMLTNSSKLFTYLLVQMTLLGCSVITVGTHVEGVTYAFNHMFVDDLMSDVLKLMSYLGVSMMLVYSRQYLMVRGMFTGEFMSLALFALLGINVMISANHFLTLYLGLELLSLSLYAMVALQRDSAVATEAAMKYFVLGALASGLLLYGMSMVYGATGTLELGVMSEAINNGVQNKALLSIGLVFIVSGLAFKLGVVPFHMWVPDVYHGAPTAMTMMIGSVPKLAAFAFVTRILVEGMQGLQADWSGMLTVLAVASMALGNLAAIAQTNIKRMFAYSTITHMGFLVLGLVSGTVAGYGASMFYAVVYVMMSLGAFGMIMILSRAGFEADTLDDFKGLNQRSPWLAFMMMLLMVSMAGVPPTVGFYAKFSVLNAIIETGHIPLAVAAVMFSLIGAFYYLRVIKVMYFDAPESHVPINLGADTGLLISLNGLGVLMLGLLPNALMWICTLSVQQSLLVP